MITMPKSLCAKCNYQNSSHHRMAYCTINSKGKHHSFDDKPAMIWADGDKCWYKDGEIHRSHGPAYLSEDKSYKAWWLNGKESHWEISQEIIVGKPIGIGEDVATVLRNLEGCFYEALLGNKKILIVGILNYVCM